MKKDNLYDLCWQYIFISDAIECFKKKNQRKTDFCYTPFYVHNMPADLKKRVLTQGKEALKRIKQSIMSGKPLEKGGLLK